jgi:GntR family transcriptional regulator
LSLVHYRWLVAGQPTQISTQWEPLRFTAETPAERPSSSARGQPSVVARFDAIGIRTTHVVEDIRARMPHANERAALEMPEGLPVFAIMRTHWAGGTPIETADIVVRADRTVITIEHPVED